MIYLISQTVYLIIAIAIILILIILFLVSYVLNKKTPVPKGCENIKVSEENCSGCNNTLCKYYPNNNINNDTNNEYKEEN